MTTLKRFLFIVALVLAAAAVASAQGSVQIVDATGTGVTITPSCVVNHNCLDVNIASGGGSGGTSSSFGAAFPSTGTAIGVKNGANMVNLAADGSSNLLVNCAVGCSASAGFADNAAFTAGTTTFTPVGGWYSTSITNCTSGSACTAQLTVDRKIFTQSFQGGTWTVTGSGGTFPVTGTFWPYSLGQQLAAASVPVVLTAAQISTLTPLSTVAVTQSMSPWIVAGGGTAGTPGTAVLAVQGVASGTPIPVSLASAPTTSVTQGTSPWVVGQSIASALNATVVGTGTFAAQVTGSVTANAGTGQFNVTCTAANCPVNEAQINGVTPLMGNGVTGTGSQRVTIASDNTAFSVNATLSAETTKVIGTINQGTSPWVDSCTAANCAVNEAQINGTTPLMGNGVTGTGSQRVTIASDNTAFSVNSTDVGTLANDGAAASTNRLGTLPAIAQTSYSAGTALTQGRNEALQVGTDGLLWTANLPAIRPASYHASASFAGSSTTVNAHLSGNATNTILVTKISMSCTQTVAGILTVTVNKTSAASSGGTAATMTAVPDDSTYAAASSAAQSFTGTGPTAGTPVGQMDAYKLGCLAAASVSPNDIYILNLRQKPIVLRGTAQTLEIGLGGAVTGGNVTVTWEWIETNTITP